MGNALPMKNKKKPPRPIVDPGASSISARVGTRSDIAYVPPSIAIYRWVILFVCCFVTVGNYFCFDIPSVLFMPLKDFFGDMNDVDFELNFNMLYIIYSLPNIILPLFGGFLIDQWGFRIMLVSYAIAVLMGEVLVAIGCSMKSFSLMLFGRSLFSLGGECLMVSILTLLSSWFEAREMASAVGVLVACTHICQIATAMLSPTLQATKGVSAVFWFGAFLCFLSILCACCVATVDVMYTSHMEKIEGGEEGCVGGGWNQCDEGEVCNTEWNEEIDPIESSSVWSPSAAHTELITLANTQANAKIGVTEGLSVSVTARTSAGEMSVSVKTGDGKSTGSRVLFTDKPVEVIPDDGGAVLGGGDAEAGPAGAPAPPTDSFTLTDIQARRAPLWPPCRNVYIWILFVCTYCVYGVVMPYIDLSNQILGGMYFHNAYGQDKDDIIDHVIPR